MSAPARGSIRRRLMLQLLGGAAVLAVVLFLIVQSLARPVSRIVASQAIRVDSKLLRRTKL